MISEMLRILVKEKGWTQRELADKSGVSEVSISRYVSGTRVPNSSHLLSLAHALGCTTDRLLGAEKVPIMLHKDASVLVSHDKTQWVRRHFERLENNKIYTYPNGLTSWTSQELNFYMHEEWEFFKLPNGEDNDN